MCNKEQGYYQSQAEVGLSDSSDLLADKPVSRETWFLVFKVSLTIFATIASWPICWWLSVAIDNWMWFPSIITTSVFYAFVWSGICAAHDLAKKAGNGVG